MSFDDNPALLEFSLSRTKAQSLLKRLAARTVDLNIRRARITAREVWMQVELTGEESRVRRAVSDMRIAVPGLVMKA